MEQGDNVSRYLMPVTGIPTSNPHSYFKDASHTSDALAKLYGNEFRSAVIRGFNLPEDDSYVYHAIASVTLSQVQAAIEAGTAHGLCDWYLDEKGTTVPAIHSSLNIPSLTASLISSTTPLLRILQHTQRYSPPRPLLLQTL